MAEKVVTVSDVLSITRKTPAGICNIRHISNSGNFIMIRYLTGLVDQ